MDKRLERRPTWSDIRNCRDMTEWSVKKKIAAALCIIVVLIIIFLVIAVLFFAAADYKCVEKDKCNLCPESGCLNCSLTTGGREKGVLCPNFAAKIFETPRLKKEVEDYLKENCKGKPEETDDVVVDISAQLQGAFTASREADQGVQAAGLCMVRVAEQKFFTRIVKICENWVSRVMTVNCNSLYNHIDTAFDTVFAAAIQNQCPWTQDAKFKPRCNEDTNEGTKERKKIYRTIDGRCNNLHQHNGAGLGGMATTPFSRLLKEDYSNRTNPDQGRNRFLPRISQKENVQLPSARKVSQAAFKTGDIRQGENTQVSNKNLSVFVMQMGQYIDHDLTNGPTNNPATSGCCDEITTESGESKSWGYPDDPYNNKIDVCFPIEIPADDDFWKTKGRRCMALTRTHTSPPIPDCSVGQRDQLNALSHWLDASNCYGSNLEEFDNVRNSTDPARLKTGLKHNLLPLCSTSINDDPKHIPRLCALDFLKIFLTIKYPF